MKVATSFAQPSKGYMRRTLFNGLFLSGLSLTLAGGSVALSQSPGSQPQSMPQRPSATAPGAENPGVNPDGNTGDSGRKMDDKKFVKDAAIGGMTEVELGKLAAQKASSDDVKQFGQKMVDDHTKANDQLKEIATKESLDVPSALDSKHQARIDKLSKLSGEAFDKAYVKDQLKDHQQDVSEFQAEAQTGTDPNLKQFASTTLPILQEHLTMVKGLSNKSK